MNRPPIAMAIALGAALGCGGGTLAPDAAPVPIDAPVDAPLDAPLDGPAMCVPPTGSAAPTCGLTGSADDTQATALEVTGLDTTRTTLDGTLPTTDIVNWYHYDAQVSLFETAEPVISVELWTSAEICVYSDCGLTAADCPTYTTPATAPGGQPGCCSSTVNSFQLRCPGDTDANVWMSVQSTQPSTCATCMPYKIGFNW